MEQAQAALAAAEANLEAAKAPSDTFDCQSFTRSYRTAKASSTPGTTALSTAAAKTAGQRSPEPLYRHSDGKTLSSGDTAAQGQHILTIRATEQCQVNLKMQPQQAAALKTGQEVIAEAAVLKKTFPGTITAIDNGTVTIMLENKLEELKAAMEVSISLKK